MPSVSKSQQHLFGMALAHKRGEEASGSSVVKRMAETMSEKQLEEFASTSSKRLPEHVKKSVDIEHLHAAREASERGLMRRKAIILSSLMKSDPHEWMVDSDAEGHHPGITHVPTGYRFHTPRRNIPPEISGRDARNDDNDQP